MRAKGTQSWALFTCVCSSRPQFSQKFWGKVLQGTERLHSTKGRKALSGTAFWAIVQLPEKVKVGLHQSVWSKTSWDVLPVWMFGEPCPRVQVAKLPSAFLEETVTQLCAWVPGEGGLCLSWIREGIFVFYFCWGMTTALWRADPVLFPVNWKGWWQRLGEGDWRLLVLPLRACHVRGSSCMWGPLPVHWAVWMRDSCFLGAIYLWQRGAILRHCMLLRVWNKGRDAWFSVLIYVDLSHLSFFYEIIFHVEEERGILSTWHPEEPPVFKCYSSWFVDPSGKPGEVATDT